MVDSCTQQSYVLLQPVFHRRLSYPETQEYDIYGCDKYTWQVSEIKELWNQSYAMLYTAVIKNKQKVR